MIYVIVALCLVIVALIIYIIRLRKEVCAHQNTWMEIEEITDHNKDGDIVIHCRHTENK